jgi:hypothetical protein
MVRECGELYIRAVPLRKQKWSLDGHRAEIYLTNASRGRGNTNVCSQWACNLHT